MTEYNGEKMIGKKFIFIILILTACLSMGAGEMETKEYAFFADTYEQAQEIALAQKGELVSFSYGIGVVRVRKDVNVKATAGEQGIKLYPDEMFTVDIETKDSQVKQWHLEVLQAEEIWGNATGKGVTVAVIDSGIDSNHEDLAEGILYAGTTIPETEYGIGQRFDAAYKGAEDYFGHGTHVAGIVGARKNEIGGTGIAPDCKLISVKALEKQGSSGKGKTSWVASGIRMAMEQGADIINLSLGGSSVKNELLHTVIKEAYEKNIIVTCAAGNIKGTPTVFYPGAYEEVIAVSAVKAAGDYVDFASSYSNYGDWVDISAPGTSLVSTIPGGYGTKTGTSMACPIISGAAALLLEEKKDLTIQEVCDLLYSSATDLGDVGRDDYYGAGVVNLKQLLQNFEEKYINGRPVFVYASGSKIRKGGTVYIEVPVTAAKVVYTLDGTLPTADSSVYSEEGITLKDETDNITINARCIMADGTLGEEVLATYKVIECNSVLKAKGESREEFPDYDNYKEEGSNYLYKIYELEVKTGEELAFQLEKNDFGGIVRLYDSSEMKNILAEGKEQTDGSQLLKWKNSSTALKNIYVLVMVTDTTKEPGKISYQFQWSVKKTSAGKPAENDTLDKEVSSETVGKHTQEESQNGIAESNTQKENQKTNTLQEGGNIIANKNDKETKAGQIEDLREEETMIYEEDWLYTMEEESISQNMAGEGQGSQNQIEEEKDSEKNLENTEKDEWKKMTGNLVAVVGIGLLLELLVIIWHMSKKKKEQRKESKK